MLRASEISQPEGYPCGTPSWVAAGNPDIGPTDNQYKKHLAHWRYAAMVEETDESLGAIRDALSESNEIDNTYVIFTSDNGGGVGRRDESGNRFQGPLQEGKRSTFEGGLRVPFVVSGPGIESGSQCDVPVVSSVTTRSSSDVCVLREPHSIFVRTVDSSRYFVHQYLATVGSSLHQSARLLMRLTID